MNQESTQYNPTNPTTSSNNQSMFSGRINRMAFFIGHVILFVVPIVLLLAYALSNFGFSMLNGGDSSALESPSPMQSSANILMYILVGSYIVFSLIVLFSLYIRRLHDINVTGWLSVLLLINPAALILYVVLQAMEGTEGHNKYGPEERPANFWAILGFRR